MNVENLTPAPWSIDGHKSNNGLCDVRGQYVGGFAQYPVHDVTENTAEFIKLARNALDVMMRRGWMPYFNGKLWYAVNDDQIGIEPFDIQSWPDPFTALVEADKWYAENVEKVEVGTK